MDSLYRRNPEILASEMDGEFVMMNANTGEYHSIRGAGVLIWELSENPVSERQIVDAICAEFDVTQEVCTADVRRFLGELLAAGLILNA